jgi:outer membrane protein assembly factor BamD (BamD/ComL family)
VEPDSTAIRDFVSRKKGARDLFEEAQAAVSVQDRLALYRQLLEEHPDADVAPQAQFMVGFIHSEELKDYDGAEQAFRELLRRYPKSELTNSARWMIEHMRSEDVPSMLRLDADSASVAAPADTTHPKAKGTSGTP